MSKTLLVIAATLVVATLPAMAQSEERRRHSAMPHIGGHYRHMHRDWSDAQGRGHVHNICWQWDPVEGWEWVCR